MKDERSDRELLELAANVTGAAQWSQVSERLPETGTQVLCQFSEMQRVAMYVGKHSINTDDRDYDGDAEYDNATDATYWSEGWYCYEDGMWVWMKTICAPTHWQRLPAAPSVVRAAADIGGMMKDPGKCYDTCSNRGRTYGTSQESYCHHCVRQESWRSDHYKPKSMPQKDEERKP